MRKRHKKARRGRRLDEARKEKTGAAPEAPDAGTPNRKAATNGKAAGEKVTGGVASRVPERAASPGGASDRTLPSARSRPIPARPQPARIPETRPDSTAGGPSADPKTSPPTPVRRLDTRDAVPAPPRKREVNCQGLVWEASLVGAGKAPGGVPLLEVEFVGPDSEAPIRRVIPGEGLAELVDADLITAIEAALRAK